MKPIEKQARELGELWDEIRSTVGGNADIVVTYGPLRAKLNLLSTVARDVEVVTGKRPGKRKAG